MGQPLYGDAAGQQGKHLNMAKRIQQKPLNGLTEGRILGEIFRGRYGYDDPTLFYGETSNETCKYHCFTCIFIPRTAAVCPIKKM